MLRLAELVRTLDGVEAAEVERWVARGWVVPESEEGAVVFGEVDVARVRLIAEIRRDCEIDEETIPVVLGLLDQVYALRRGLKEILEVLEEQPEDVRKAVAAAISRRHADQTASS
jgi:chaperone modulatory protein CbpM